MARGISLVELAGGRPTRFHPSRDEKVSRGFSIARWPFERRSGFSALRPWPRSAERSPRRASVGSVSFRRCPGSIGATFRTLVLAAGNPQEPRTKAARVSSARLELEGATDFSRRALVIVPRGLGVTGARAGARAPARLGETSSDALGVRAMIDGTVSSATSPSFASAGPTQQRTWRSDRARASRDQTTGLRTFLRRTHDLRLPVHAERVATPPTPSPRSTSWDSSSREVLLPRSARKRRPTLPTAPNGIDGCSLGGVRGARDFLRHPTAFGSWGGVQGRSRRSGTATSERSGSRGP